MKIPTVSVQFALFAYGGNGGTSSLIPELAVWFAKAYHRLKTDSRVHSVGHEIYSDTPIYMTRNRAIKEAREAGYDFLLMLDSDNEPDAYWGRDPEAQLFLNEPFTFAYERLTKGLPTFLAAPYCGPPPHPLPKSGIIDGGEVPYLFHFDNRESWEVDWGAAMYSRAFAASLKGIHPVPVLPTGVCLSSLSVWDGPPRPYFDYEHDEEKTEKRSTEDCYATRNLSYYWQMTKGIEVCFAACDSWALHHKPKRVGKPVMPTIERIAKNMRETILSGLSDQDEYRTVDYTQNISPVSLPRRGQVLGPNDDCVVITESDMEQARILLERELATGSEIADIQSPQLIAHDPSHDESSTQDKKENPEAHIDHDYRKNGHAIKHKMIGGHKVAIINEWELSDETVENLVALTGWLVDKKGGPLDVAVAHCGSGQGAAAILSQLPDGSHLYALDGTSSYRYSQSYAEQFSATFQRELETGRVMAQVTSRKFPWPETKQHLDLVFVERFCTEDKIKKWSQHVTLGGVIAGLGEGPEGAQVAGEVWALPIAGVKARA